VKLHPNVVLLVAVGVVLWLASRGRLANLVAALEGKRGTTNTPAPTGSTSGYTGPLPSTSGGVPSAGMFGVQAPNLAYGESYGNIAQVDQQGLRAFGGGAFAHDFNWSGPNVAGQAIHLPAGTYEYLGDQVGGWGNLLGFRPVDPQTHQPIAGDTVEFTHVENLAQLVQGQDYQGGMVIGTVGKGPYDPNFWTGPHLGVIVDQGGLAWLEAPGSQGVMNA
jgi:hypothetical protein